MVDMLAIIISKAKENGQVEEIVPHLVEDGWSILWYAVDMVLFLDHDTEQAMNMKLLLSTFEQLSGLKINFYKSEISILGKLITVRCNIHNYLVAN